MISSGNSFLAKDRSRWTLAGGLSLLKTRLSQRSCVVRSDRLFGWSWSARDWEGTAGSDSADEPRDWSGSDGDGAAELGATGGDRRRPWGVRGAHHRGAGGARAAAPRG